MNAVQSVERQKASRRRRALAAAFSVSASLSGVLLLAVAAWFLTGAAIAGAAAGAGAAGAGAVLAFNYLLPSALIRLLAILRTAGRYGERYASHRAALLAMAELRTRLFRGLAARDPRHDAVLSEGEVAARVAGDIDEMEAMLVRSCAVAGALAAALAALAAAGFAGRDCGMAVAALFFVLHLGLRRLASAGADPARRSVEALGAWRARLVEFAGARAEIAAYGLEVRAMAALEPFMAEYEAARLALEKSDAALAAAVQIAGGIAVVLVLALGHADAPLLALAGLAAAAGVEAQGAFAGMLLQRARAGESLRRLEFLEGESEEGVACMPLPLGAALSLGGQALPPGDRIGLTGESGTGKTTVLEALAGMRAAPLDARLGGIEVASAPLAELTGRFALSPQAAPVIVGTVADNLRLARPGIDEADMWRALECACLAARVRSLSLGLEEKIGAGGLALSGGERKRLSLARALLAARPWLLLDEPTEGLDAATEAEVVARLRLWLERTGTGLILASHRPAPMALATRSIEARAVFAPRT